MERRLSINATSHHIIQGVIHAITCSREMAPLLHNQKIIFYCDNVRCDMCINSGKDSDPNAVDSHQRLFWLSVLYNCNFKAVYLSSEQNFLLDALSMAHTPAFKQKAIVLLRPRRHEWSQPCYPFANYMLFKSFYL